MILYRLQMGEVVSTVPTIGFNVETVQYNNIKSALPSRVMYFRNGEWNDFSENITASLRDVFQSGKSVVEVSIDSSLNLLDFLRMIQIDLATGTERSIAQRRYNNNTASMLL